MTNIEFYNKSKEYLCKIIDEYNQKKENKILVQDVENLLNGYYATDNMFERLFMSAQNYQGMPNYIGYFNNPKVKEEVRKTLYFPDYIKASKAYNSWEKLFGEFSKNIDMRNSQKSWMKYSKAIFNGVKFISKFKDENEFEEYVNSFSNDPKEIANDFKGIFGFALTCDYLKEQGFLQYSKPDVHIKDVLSNLLINQYNFKYKSLLLSDQDYFDFILDIAKDNNTSSYNVDKLIWLCCTGNFHHPHGISTSNTNRGKYLRYLRLN